MDLDFYKEQAIPAETKIVMLILDGLGGLPREPGGRTELESARKPNLDALAKKSSLGLTIPVAPGITAGSGPGHLAIFGYDPIKYQFGRGAMEALGVDFDLGFNDLAARGNFCQVDSKGVLVDRRAGRLPTETSRRLAEILRTIKLEEVETFVEPVKEHRFAFVMRGQGLAESITETDPLKNGIPPLQAHALKPDSVRTAKLINQYVREAGRLLANETPANMILLRGFSRFPTLPMYQEVFGLNPAAIAFNGMYRGVARMVGMNILDVPGEGIPDVFSTLEKHWKDFDFFYLHVKRTDTCAENGDFDGKVRAIEEVDAQIPRLLALKPDVIIIGGDHSSPSVLKSHSWHPVPVLLHSASVRADGMEFGESTCARGCLGTVPATHIMPLALASAGRIGKFGA